MCELFKLLDEGFNHHCETENYQNCYYYIFKINSQILKVQYLYTLKTNVLALSIELWKNVEINNSVESINKEVQTSSIHSKTFIDYGNYDNLEKNYVRRIQCDGRYTLMNVLKNFDNLPISKIMDSIDYQNVLFKIVSLNGL